jgi:hypothetical protein
MAKALDMAEYVGMVLHCDRSITKHYPGQTHSLKHGAYCCEKVVSNLPSFHLALVLTYLTVNTAAITIRRFHRVN